ncbi:uncharacterized protein LOC144616831 isoform X3 [Panthera onca]
MKIQIEFVTQLPRTLRPGFQVQSSCRESAAHAHAHRALRQGRFLPCLTLCSLCFSGACGAVSPSPRARSVGCPKCTASGRNAIVLKAYEIPWRKKTAANPCFCNSIFSYLSQVMLGARVVKRNRRQLSTWQGPNSAGEIILFPRSLPIIQKIHKSHCR